jgi:cytidine deaminase
MQQFGFAYQQALKAQLPAHIQELITAAEQAADKAYAPYSNFKVGAALVQDDGRLLTGANHENAAFPAGICAERALFGALDMGSGKKVKAIAIAYKTEKGEHHPPLSPCGICRQTILEAQLHQQQPIAVYMSSPDGQVILLEDASYLLPFHFSSEYL